MSRLSTLLFVLALGSAAAATLPATDAFAQQARDPLPAPGLIEFLPTGMVIADGATPARQYLLALGPSGAPITDLRPKLTASDGAVTGFSHLGGGLYAFDYLPAQTSERRTVSIELKGKVGRSKIEALSRFDVVPPRALGLTVTAYPDEVVLGDDVTTTIQFTLVGSAGQPLDGARMLVSTSSGAVKGIVDNGDGTFTGRFTPKAVNFPHVALVTAADARDPLGTTGFAVVRMSGRVDYPILAPAGAAVSLEVAGTTFGPVTAGVDGRAKVPVTVPPGVGTARVTTIVDGTPTVAEIDLRIPESRRVALFPTPSAVPADPSRQVPLRALVLTATGEPDPEADVRFIADAGKVGEVRHLGGGVFEALWTAPATSGQDVNVVVEVGEESEQVAHATLNLVAPLPLAVELRADPAVLEPGATDLAVTAVLTGPDGNAMPGRAVVFTGGGAQLAGEIEVVDGGYVGRFETNPAGPVEVLARVDTPNTGSPPQRLLVLPARNRLANDGVSGTPVLVTAVDGWGHPVPGVSITLEAIGTDGSVTPAVTTDAKGMALALYSSGTAATVAGLRARSGNLEAAASLLQVPASVPPVALPVVGDPGQVALTDRWNAGMALVRVEHGGELAPAWSGAVAATEGGTAVDGQAEVEGEGAIEGGDPEAEALPAVEVADATETSEGEATDQSDAAEVAEAEPAETAVAAEAAASDFPTSERPPSPRRESQARFRASYVFSTYRYEQTPNGNGGPLLDSLFSVGGDNGGSAALPQGFEISGRAWVPKVDYVGVHAAYRATYYGVTTEAFAGEVAHDTLHDIELDAIGRYPFRDASGVFWVGARVGLHIDDLIYFTEEQQASAVVYKFDTLIVPSLAVGLEAGGEVGDLWFTGGVVRNLAYARNGYAVGLDADVGYDVAEGLSVAGGLGYQSRGIGLVGEESGDVRGELVDGQFLMKAGVALAF